MSSKSVIELGPFSVSGGLTNVATFDIAGFAQGILVISVSAGSSPGTDYTWNLYPVDPQSGNTCTYGSGSVDGGILSPSVTSGAFTGYLTLPSLHATRYQLQVNISASGSMTFTATVIVSD